MRPYLPFTLLLTLLSFSDPFVSAQSTISTASSPASSSRSSAAPSAVVTTYTTVGLAVSMSGTVAITVTTTIAQVATITPQASSTRNTVSSNLPTANTNINGGGGGGAPSPGAGGQDRNGPNDNYVAGAMARASAPLLYTLGGLAAGVGLLAL